MNGQSLYYTNIMKSIYTTLPYKINIIADISIKRVRSPWEQGLSLSGFFYFIFYLYSFHDEFTLIADFPCIG